MIKKKKRGGGGFNNESDDDFLPQKYMHGDDKN